MLLASSRSVRTKWALTSRPKSVRTAAPVAASFQQASSVGFQAAEEEQGPAARGIEEAEEGIGLASGEDDHRGVRRAVARRRAGRAAVVFRQRAAVVVHPEAGEEGFLTRSCTVSLPTASGPTRRIASPSTRRAGPSERKAASVPWSSSASTR